MQSTIIILLNIKINLKENISIINIGNNILKLKFDLKYYQFY